MKKEERKDEYDSTKLDLEKIWVVNIWMVMFISIFLYVYNWCKVKVKFFNILPVFFTVR